MRIIGLTGSMACGKSTVSAYLRSKGFPIIDCDTISRDALEQWGDVYGDVVATFGKGILKEDGNVDRKELARIVFADREKLELLNSMIHPVVIGVVKKMLELYKQHGVKTVVVDAPLLIEAGMTDLVNEVWVIYSSPEIQIKRAMARDGSTREEVEERIRRQMPTEEKMKYADVLIKNDSSEEALFEEINNILNRGKLCKDTK